MHPLVDGQPMACVSVITLQRVLPDTIVVVRPDQHDLIAQLAAQGIQTITLAATKNPAFAADGMGLSIATGIAATQEAKGWLITLADMPFIEPATIARVLAALQNGNTIAAPVYQGRRGHPVGFSAVFGEALRALSGDQGARDLLVKHAAEIALIDCDDPGILADVDNPKDLPTGTFRPKR